MNSSASEHSTIVPALRYRDAHAAIAFFTNAFGFKVHALYEGPEHTVAHAQLTLGGGMIMLGSASNGGELANQLVAPDEIGLRTTTVFSVTVPDAAAVFDRASAAGATFVAPLAEMSYGGKAFSCRDPEGHLWSFGEYDPWAG